MSKYYTLNTKVKLRKGGRTILKMSEKEFGEKAKKFILDTCKDSDWVIEKVSNTDSTSKIISYLPNAIRQIYWDDKKGKTTIKKDFKGIQPDWENYEMTGGLRTVKGAPYIMMYVGGDWECPICVMVYHDGKQFRCYIPEKGNPYRKDTKMLFGNCDPSYDSKTETYNDEVKLSKAKKIVPSDDKYVFDQLVKDGVLDKEKDKEKMRGIGRSVDFDKDMCIEDFSSRVEVKESINYDKQLYNKIINNIAKVVKKQLNEKLFDDNDELLNTDDESTEDELNIADNIKLFDGELIDLGLPSGTLWCDRNIDAKDLSDVGSYYQWGSLTPVDKNSKIRKKTYTLPPNTLNETPFSKEFDIAYQKYGTLHMPTKELLIELADYCVPKTRKINGVMCIVLISSVNGNKLVFPKSGYIGVNGLKEPGLLYIWSNTFKHNTYFTIAYDLTTGYSGGLTLYPNAGNDCYKAMPIRAVYNNKHTNESIQLNEKLFDNNDELLNNDELTLDDLSISKKLLPEHAIDLGLPSGTLWYNRNLYAENPYDTGKFYQWCTSTGLFKNSISIMSIDHNKYNYKKLYSLAQDPANIFDKQLKTPSLELFNELINFCTSKYVYREDNVCLEFTSPVTHQKLYLPGVGYLSQLGSTRDGQACYFTNTEFSWESGYAFINNMCHTLDKESMTPIRPVFIKPKHELLDESHLFDNDLVDIDDTEEISDVIQKNLKPRNRYKIYINAGTQAEMDYLNELVFNTKKEAIEACKNGIDINGRIYKYPLKCIVTEDMWNLWKGIKVNKKTVASVSNDISVYKDKRGEYCFEIVINNRHTVNNISNIFSNLDELKEKADSVFDYNSKNHLFVYIYRLSWTRDKNEPYEFIFSLKPNKRGKELINTITADKINPDYWTAHYEEIRTIY